MTIDEKAGLPELPEGQFWRIEDTPTGLWIRLMERSRVIIQGAPKRSWLPWGRPTPSSLREVDTSHEVASMPIILGLIDPARAAREILSERSLLGDYPPKRYGQGAS